MANLLDWVIEQRSRYFNELILHEDNTAHLSVGNLKDSTGGKLTDVRVLMRETGKKLLKNVRLKGKIEFVSLVEILIDLDENFGAQNIILLLEILSKLLVSKGAISKSKCALWHRFWVDLVPVQGNETIVSKALLHGLSSNLI